MHHDNVRIVCLCGSTRFKAEFLDWAARLTLEGCIVLMPHVYSHADQIDLSDEQRQVLETIHLQKIAMAHEVLVLNVHGYIGQGLQRELQYAHEIKKPVRYLY